MPHRHELQGIVHYGLLAAPNIDNVWFPYTVASFFWSGSPGAGGATYAWGVDFSFGYASIGFRSSAVRVRLVRAGR